MKLPPEIQFHEDIRLLVWRPRGLLDEAAINKVLSALEDLEAKPQAPFNRFSDTSETREVELNFRYVIHAALHWRLSHTGRVPVKSAILATDSTLIHYARLLAVLTQGSSTIAVPRQGFGRGTITSNGVSVAASKAFSPSCAVIASGAVASSLG